MSNALHHVAPASFFPTAKELSSGIQWFKEHPILAAAAATAVSVITYLHTADDDASAVEMAGDAADAELSKDSAVGGTDASSGHNCTSPTRRASAPLTTAASVAPSPPIRRTSVPGRATPPVLRKPGSEGKLTSSPAAVSWVDEHGGSLTQVFEHLEINDQDEPHESDGHRDPINDSVYPDLDRPLSVASASASARFHGRPPTPRRHAKPASEEAGAKDDAVQPNPAPHWMGALAHGGVQSPQPLGGSQPSHDRQTASPQWGWYVAITPPRDHLAEAPGPSSSSSSSPSSPSSSSTETSMRRSTSGRIQA